MSITSINIDRTNNLRKLLASIEGEMRKQQLWQDQQPSREALASTEPFCVNTMDLSDWIQWVLIPKMRELLDKELPLPSNCNINAIVEESFKGLTQDCSKLLSLIHEFDQNLSLRH